MAKDYPTPLTAGSATPLSFHDAASEQNLSILQTRLDVARAVEKRAANYLRIAKENDEDVDFILYLVRKLAAHKLTVSRSETRLEREKVAALERVVSHLQSLLVLRPSETPQGLEKIERVLRKAGY